MSKSEPRTEPGYWEGRLYRPAFRYRGRLRRVPAWYVKVQWRGRRRAVRLQARERFEAAREAAALYRALATAGWDGVDQLRSARGPVGVTEAAGEGASSLARGGVTTRKYVNNLNPGFERELFAQLTEGGITEHVPLGTEDHEVGRLRAAELSQELQRDGWARFRLSHAREATVSVFWQANPMTCTYTTFLTLPARGGGGAPPPQRARGWRVLIIEPDGSVRRALVHWLSRSAGVARLDSVPLPSEVDPRQSWDLILANREQPAAALRELFPGTGDRLAPLLLTHGVFADSDAIFASFSGVSQGYLLRRLPPADLLAPVLQPFPESPPRLAAELDRQVRRYFQAIFESDPAAGSPQAPDFSAREQEVLDLLSRGFSDKELAQELGISVWTVHSHLKRIFAKYGVRTRTEAVVKHLQK